MQGNPLNTWTSDPVFSGLTPGETYYAFVRVTGVPGLGAVTSGEGAPVEIVPDVVDPDGGDGNGGNGGGDTGGNNGDNQGGDQGDGNDNGDAGNNGDSQATAATMAPAARRLPMKTGTRTIMTAPRMRVATRHLRTSLGSKPETFPERATRRLMA